MKQRCSTHAGIGAIAVAVVVVAGALVSGCGGTDAATAGQSGSGKSGSAKGATIAFSSTALTNPYTTIFSQVIQRDAKSTGFDMLPTVDSNSDSSKQLTDVRTLLGEGIKGLLVTVVATRAAETALNEAQAKGVPVIGMDTGPDPGYGKVYMTVTTSEPQLGVDACQLIGKRLQGKGTVLELQGPLDSSAGLLRTDSFNKCIHTYYPHIAIVAKETSFTEEGATVATQTVLSTDPSVDAIYTESDSSSAPGIIPVLERLHRLKRVGQPGHVTLVGIDGSPYALKMIREGYMDATVGQPLTEYATDGLEYLKDALAGKTVQPGPTGHGSTIVRQEPGGNLEDLLPAQIITQANASDPNFWGNE